MTWDPRTREAARVILSEELQERAVPPAEAPALVAAAARLAVRPRALWAAPRCEHEQLVFSLALSLRRLSGSRDLMIEQSRDAILVVLSSRQPLPTDHDVFC